MFIAVIASGCFLACTASEPETLTVAAVVKALILDESKFEYEDEPPGKLRAVSCEATLRDAKLKVRVRIEVLYTPDLFSAERKWEPRAVRAAAVAKVTISPAGRPN